MTCHAHDDEWQGCASRAPWQMGTELYEAYGRFLDRVAAGTVESIVDLDERAEYMTTPGISRTGAYDANLGFFSDVEIDAHLQREKAKERRALAVDLSAQIDTAQRRETKAAASKRRRDAKIASAKTKAQTWRRIRQFNRPFIAKEVGAPGMVLVRLENEGKIRRTGEVRHLKKGSPPRIEWEIVPV